MIHEKIVILTMKATLHLPFSDHPEIGIYRPSGQWKPLEGVFPKTPEVSKKKVQCICMKVPLNKSNGITVKCSWKSQRRFIVIP